MTIGVNIPVVGGPPMGLPLSEVLARPGVVAFASIEGAARGGCPAIQGDPLAVAPMGDLATNQLAPPIAGGLQMELRVIVTDGQPVTISAPYQPQGWLPSTGRS